MNPSEAYVSKLFCQGVAVAMSTLRERRVESTGYTFCLVQQTFSVTNEIDCGCVRSEKTTHDRPTFPAIQGSGSSSAFNERV